MKQIKDREKRKDQEKDLKEKLMFFDRLPNECVACLTPFDRKNKEMVLSWTVVVREQEDVVRLYCPICINKAKAIVEDYEKKQKIGNLPDTK